MSIRVTTFNLENLFNRYAFLDKPWNERNYEKTLAAYDVASIASRAGDLVKYEISDIQRNNTAHVILDAKPDILAVQEVENLYTLRIFNRKYLSDYFDRMLLIDGNDPRGIDVGFLVREGFAGEIVNVRTHVDEPSKGKNISRSASLDGGYRVAGAIFSRDCLEVDVRYKSQTLTFLVNHFKAQDREKASIERRKKQAERVAELVKWNAKEGRLPIVLGDLNVPPTQDGSLDPLLKLKLLKDHFSKETWTHYYDSERKVSRLDYILPDARLKAKAPEFVRKGLTKKCKQYTGERYPTIGIEHTEASDHCAVTLHLDV